MNRNSKNIDVYLTTTKLLARIYVLFINIKKYLEVVVLLDKNIVVAVKVFVESIIHCYANYCFMTIIIILIIPAIICRTMIVCLYLLNRMTKAPSLEKISTSPDLW